MAAGKLEYQTEKEQKENTGECLYTCVCKSMSVHMELYIHARICKSQEQFGFNTLTRDGVAYRPQVVKPIQIRVLMLVGMGHGVLSEIKGSEG